MTEVPSRTPHAASPAGPPPIVVVHSFSGSTTFSFYNQIVGGLRVLGIYVGFLLVAAGLLMRLRGGLSIGLVALIVGMQFAFFLILWLPRLIRYHRAWRAEIRRQSNGASTEQDESTKVRLALLEVGGVSRARWYGGRAQEPWRSRFQKLLREAGLPSALVIVQDLLEESIRTIEVPDEFVEPERLQSAMPRGSRSYWMQLGIIALLIWMVVNSSLSGDWIQAAMFVFVLAVLGMQLLKSFGIHLEEARAPVMGMGVYSDHKGRRWTVLDSTLYLYPLKIAFHRVIIAELIGPDGHAAMQFHGLNDPGLQMFWQRWMHPHPRPDLV